MAIRPFLAMTAAEIRGCSDFPPEIAWMACHFSPYCTGLSNLPRTLKPGSLLVLDDVTPIHGHDPEEIAEQLTDCVKTLDCSGILLDFQRPDNEETAALVKTLTKALPCPVAVSEMYAGDGASPVFLPPVPPSVPLGEHLAPWAGREVWLEIALGGERIVLTENGAAVTPLPSFEVPESGFGEETLHCHYHADVSEDKVTFTLWRTREDLDGLMEEAREVGVTHTVGLYQELRNFVQPKPSPQVEALGAAAPVHSKNPSRE